MAPNLWGRLTNPKNAILAFAGIITAASMLAIFTDTPIFPPIAEPTGDDPETWSTFELREWLRRRDLEPVDISSRAELVELVRRHMRGAQE
ncbi:hypothetical protein EX30DRAFT_110362 [Ascodesmis nigricans]|uniref:STE24 endopeptidase n=1 Tax=Ascodesmis nigricans TaxID=341454 RepID=A0A4S2MQE6_9PEZI|nr:hypothetical protein EX30DRAFT_110362 [Ascodesmis nigricans]